MALTTFTTPQDAARWLRSHITGELRTDSRHIRPGDAFIAWPGAAHDGRRFVSAALAAGATACLIEAEGAEAFPGCQDPRVAAWSGLKAATGPIADAFYAHPSRSLRLVASTGTNGKTSTSWWTAQALSLLGLRCGVVGTLGIGTPPVKGLGAGQLHYTGLTTPDPVALHAGLRDMKQQRFGACAVEASSIGIVEQRLAGTHIEVALFTNFTRDHLDYHGTMEAYWQAKRQLFSWPGLKSVVLNVDDPQGAELVAALAGRRTQLWTCSMVGEARLMAQDVAYHESGLSFTAVEGGHRVPISTSLVGDYNVSNLLVVMAGLRAMGFALLDIARVIPWLTPVPGRLQRANVGRTPGLPEVIIDYAHTPDALDKALAALQPLAQARGGWLWCVFGCGGNRDATKRPVMGNIAARRADRVIVTSDNPRDEAAQTIINQVMAGVPPGPAVRTVTIQPDRRLAIFEAISSADTKDVILLAGKGHEDYQEIAGVRQPFSDLEEATKALAARSPA
jgi:UDP-N-acetylmuramyl-tripeptide synthetase